jgi:hypothetical protein
LAQTGAARASGYPEAAAWGRQFERPKRFGLSWPVTAAPPAERLTVGHDAGRLTMDAPLMASSLPARVAARHDAPP